MPDQWFDQWFLSDGARIALCLPYHHDSSFVALSYVVAAFAAYTAFDLIGRVRATFGLARFFWLGAAGLSMGFGIWAMHFVAMLAVVIDLPVGFDAGITALSAAFAVIASAFAFAILAKDKPTIVRLWSAGLVLGTGIGLMHYTGMEALRLPAHVYYDPKIFALSLVVAVVLSTVALYVLARMPKFHGRGRVVMRVTSSVVMGFAIVLMHYTGMFATVFLPEPVAQGITDASIDRPLMGMAVAFVSLVMAGATLIAAWCDRRIKHAEAMLRNAVNSITDGFVIFDAEDRLVMCNDAYRKIFALGAETLAPGMLYEDLMRLAAAKGGAEVPGGIRPEWFAERLRLHKQGDSVTDYPVANGRWILATNHRMNDGGMAGLRVDITPLKNAQSALRASEERLDRAQSIAGIGSWELDLKTGKYLWSREMYRIRGLAPGDIDPDVDNVARYVHPDDYPAVRRHLNGLAGGEEQVNWETRIVRPDGDVRLLAVEGMTIRDADGAIRRLAGTMQDITERRLIERQLSQAQKMEAIGNLTGGMAHDFNNGLGVIIGNLDLLARQVRADTPAGEMCGEAREAALRCADLIRGLLAFARRQPLQARQTDVNVLVDITARLLDRTLGEPVDVRLNLEPDLWPAMTDVAQLEAALINLATNARDAMPKGGLLQINTRNTELDDAYASLHPEAVAGSYVLIEVSDTGEGIAPEIIGRIFEPFFSTKPFGKGTGLGLSMVFGFVKQSGGHLDVYSEIGHGTTFRIYLPRARSDAEAGAVVVESGPVVGGSETILVVEDNSQLRRMAVQQLRDLGYRVIETENADVALRALDEEKPIDLVFSDVVMPGSMDGYELAKIAITLPEPPEILLTSGFPAIRSPDHQLRQTEFPLLGKPYRMDELAHAVRGALDRHHAASAAHAMQAAARRPELASGEIR